MPVVSNPALELYDLLSKLKSVQSNKPAYTVLAGRSQTQPHSVEYFEVLGALSNRFAHVDQLFEQSMEGAAQQLGRATLTQLAQILSPNFLQTEWRSVAAQVLTDGNLQVLLMSSPTIGRVSPTMAPTPEEQKQIIEQLDEAIAALADYNGTVTVAIRSALSGTRRMLANFDVFGADAITEQLLRAFVLRQADENEHEVPHNERKSRSKAFFALAVVAGMITGSDAMISALENHYSRAQHVLQLVVGETKQLPPPADAEDIPPVATLPNEARRPEDDVAG